jgi:hypothetical protein
MAKWFVNGFFGRFPALQDQKRLKFTENNHFAQHFFFPQFKNENGYPPPFA